MAQMFFSVFGQTSKHMFLTVFGSASISPRPPRAGRPARGRPAPKARPLPPLRRRVIDIFVAMWRIISRIGTHVVESEID